ncbi:GntP family permease [Peptoniphilaceae bacterium SGI.131]
MFGIIGLILAIVILVVGAFKGLAPLPLTLLAALVAICTNGLNVWQTFTEAYMKGYAGTYISYFLIFSFSALYAKTMEESGSATAIGYKFIDWFGKGSAMLIGILLSSLLTYGGVSLFVVVFAAGPILFLLFKEANLPRHLIMAAFGMGTCTYTMTSLPGTPALTNIIPTKYLGTTMTAAPVLSILISIGLFVLCYFYCQNQVKVAKARGEGWTYAEGMDTSKYEISDRGTLPVAWKAFTPIIVLLLIIIVGGQFIKDSALLTVSGMILATVLCYFLNYDKMKGKNLINLLNIGLGGGVSAIGGLAAVVAFGTVAQKTDAYAGIVNWLLSLKMNPYVEGVFSTAVISGITGSSSGGLRLTLEALTPHFMTSGVNLDILHRLMSVAAGSLDTLPHSAGLFLVLSYLGLTHKNGYKHLFFTSVLIPTIVVVVATIGVVLLGV